MKLTLDSGELLGEYAGFAGASISAGFSGFLAPLWSVDDDVAHGIVAMFQHMRRSEPTITFPYGDRGSQQKMDRLLKTLLVFDPDFGGNKHADDDLPHAMWFPQKWMDRWGHEWVDRAVVDYDQTPYAWRTAYPSQTTGQSRRLRVVREGAAA